MDDNDRFFFTNGEAIGATNMLSFINLNSVLATRHRTFRLSVRQVHGNDRTARIRTGRIEQLEPRILLSGLPIVQTDLLSTSNADSTVAMVDEGIDSHFSKPSSNSGSGAGSPVAGLIHQWKLDELSGSIAVDTVGSADGTLVNMAGDEWTDGFHDGGLAFDGVNDYITVGQVPTLQLPGSMTIAAWVNVHNYFPQWGGIAGWVHDTGSTESGYCLNTMLGGGLAFGLKTTNGGMTYLTATGYETDTWYHLAGTYDGSTQRLYVNGQEVAQQAKAGAIDWSPVSPDGFEIGRYHDDNENILLPETIDDVRVYDRALTPVEIVQITEMTPVGLWEFDDANNLTAATIGNDLTLTGTHSAVPGYESGDGAAQIGIGSHYAMDHGIPPSGGGSAVNEFTLVLDVMAPAVNRWIALYQTDPANADDGDAFVRASNNTIGVSATGYSSEAIAANQWYRIVFAVDNGNRYDIYLNGEKILDGDVQPIDGRFSLDSVLLVFADENAEDNTINVSRLAIFDWAVSDDQAAVLGGIALTELGFVTNPYLQNAKTDGITVMWEMADNVPMSVEYGLDTSYGNSVVATNVPSGFQGTYIYNAEITGLTQETEYQFRVLDSGSSPLTENRQFTTFTSNPIDFNFAMWSDSQGTNRGTWSADPYAPTTSMFDHMVSQDVEFGFSTGDLAENGGRYWDAHAYYVDRVAEHLGQSVPWFNAWGNHDGGSSSVLRKFADMPSEDRGAPYHSGYGSFAFEQAGVLFIAIDYFSDSDITNGFLEGVLQDHPDARFTVLGIHVPPYCERWINGSSGLRSTLVPLAEQYGIDVIVSGHTHEYERGELNDVYYVITGGGSWLDHPEPIVRDWDHMTVGGVHDLPGEWSVESSPGVLGDPQPIVGGLVNQYTEFVVHGTMMDVRMHAFNADGSYIGILDNFTISRPIAGDFNSDGAVNGDDFLAWQAGFGIQSGAMLEDGDADADGDVDGDDFLIWQNGFQAGSGSAAANTGGFRLANAIGRPSQQRTTPFDQSEIWGRAGELDANVEAMTLRNDWLRRGATTVRQSADTSQGIDSRATEAKHRRVRQDRLQPGHAQQKLHDLDAMFSKWTGARSIRVKLR